jgi:hypothetical protein
MSGKGRGRQEQKEHQVEVTLSDFIKFLYTAVISFRDEDLSLWYEEISYKGFNRDWVFNELKRIVGDANLIIKIIILIAVRGPVKAASTKLPNGLTLLEMGIRASGGRGVNILTCGKIGAATADIAAYYLKKLNFPKRMNMELPGWLQFPSAGSIKLPNELREAHKQFAKKFSELIGGEFNEQIYEQMAQNAYLEPTLNLFS